MTTQLLRGRYRLGERIATGGMGSVFAGFDESLHRAVAIKVLKTDPREDPTVAERFRREARAAARLNHPNICRVFDLAEEGGRSFFVMELVEGETLAERIVREGRLPWREAFGIGVQVADALGAAHARGLVHRDVKPGNILLDADGHVKVTDFGIALAAQGTRLTSEGVVLGTANYVAPEQAQGLDVGPAADLYSLGCVLFEAITGTPPYTGPSQVAIATQHVSSPVVDPRGRRSGVQDNVAAVLLRAMEKSPERRFASAGDMAAALRAELASPARLTGRGSPAAPVMPPVAPPSMAPPTPPVPLPALADLERPDRTAVLPAAGRTDAWPAAEEAVRAHPVAPPRRRRRGHLALGGIVLVLIALAAGALWATRGGGSPPAPQRPSASSKTATIAEVQVPNVVGVDIAQASNELKDRGLEVVRVVVNRGKLPRGQVISQSLAPGTKVARGTTVRLVVAGRHGHGKGGGGDGD